MADLGKLRDEMDRVFNLQEIESLCFDLGLMGEKFPSDTKRPKIEALIGYMNRRDRLEDLIRACQEKRPHVFWAQYLTETTSVAAGSPVTVDSSLHTNIWYINHRFGFFEIRNPDIGLVEIKDETLCFTGEQSSLIIPRTQIKSVTHTRFSGDYLKNWVEVEFVVLGESRVAYFCEAKRLGWGNLAGGSHDLFIDLRRLIE